MRGGNASDPRPNDRPGHSALTAAGAVGLLLGALALRPQLIAVGPLLPLIQADLVAPHSVIGLLSTIPLFCMGVFSLAAPAIAGRIGPKIAITVCLVGVGLAGIARAAAPDVAWLVLLTIPIGVAIGIGGALMPVLVRNRFRARPAFATGMYTNGYQLGSAIVGAVAVPAALVLGGWRGSLGAISVALLVLTVGWLVLTPSDDPRPAERAEPGHWPLRNPVAWALVASFALRAIIFQGLIAWLPATYVERGWDPAAAGALTVALIVAGMPVTVLATWMADRVGSRRQYLGTTAATLLVSMVGLLVLPDPGWLWAALIGASLGVLFPLTMALPLDIADRPADVAAAAGMMLGAGYMIAGFGPAVLGAIRDATGSFSGSIAALVVVAAALFVSTLALAPARLAARPLRGR